MSTNPIDAAVPFAYRAQTAEGATVNGTIDAINADDARWRLTALSLRVFDLTPADAARLTEGTPKAARLSAEDFAAFNQQLAQLVSAGMPIESGLRLIAQDMRTRRLGKSIEAVAAELERGVPLQEAFERHAGSFPALYGRVLEAGVKAGDLPGILLNLGRHLELMQQMRRALWRAAAYPLMALLAFCAVMAFIGFAVAPQMRQIIPEEMELPWITRAVFAIGERMPIIALVVLGLLVLLTTWVQWVRYSGREQGVIDRLLLGLPLIGPIVRANLVARWCDAVGLGVGAGLDLPRSVDLAARATGSPALREDSVLLLAAHNTGRPFKDAGGLRVITPTVTAAADMAVARGDLKQVLSMLTGMYQRNSEHALGVAIAVLSPLMLIAVGMLLAFVIAGMFMPMIRMIENVTG